MAFTQDFNPMKVVFFGWICSISVISGEGGYPPNNYGGYGYGGGYVEKKNPYLPAPPGETPTCAKNGATYCDKVESYPTEVISYLLYKWGRTYEQFIKSESDRDFFLISKTYGAAPLPYDSYYPSQDEGGYLPPIIAPNATKTHVDSYYRKNKPTGYDYSYSIPLGSSSSASTSSTAIAAVIPPLLHSVWWSTREHNGWGQQEQQQQRWRRRVKRQSNQNTVKEVGFPKLQTTREINVKFNKHVESANEAERLFLSAQSLCPVTSNFITPQAAMNNAGNWMFVLNLDAPQYTQQVRSEICANGDGSPCSGLCSVAPGRSATCRQKYVQKRLIALDGSGGSLRNDVFWFPHCCSCEVS